MGTRNLADYQMEIHEFTSTTVVMVAGGYPGEYQKGHKIVGLEEAGKGNKSIIFHAGTKLSESGEVLTNGGRVMAVTGIGQNLDLALQNAYQTVSEICWDDLYFRKDIGQDIINLKK